MPSIPKFLADIADSSFTKAATVTHVQYYHKSLKLVRMRGQQLQNLKYRAGWQIECRVSDTAFRHYTPSLFDTAEGICEVVFYLHGPGPGSAWADELNIDSTVRIMGPAMKKIDLAQGKDAVLLGDESAIGLMTALQRGITGVNCTGAVEMVAGLLDAPKQLGLKVQPIIRQNSRGQVLLDWLKQNLQQNRQAQFYIAGHKQTNNLLKDYLSDNGIDSSSISVRHYWADGKRGL